MGDTTAGAGFAQRPGYFTDDLMQADPEVYQALQGELNRQQDQIELIASENLVSRASLQALGSVFTNKTVEGYPGRRYYGGAEFADIVEQLAIDRAKALFGCEFANVQPHSGSQANQAVYLALLKPGDTILSMALASGGHLSHGAAPNLTGKWFAPVQYGVRRQDGRIDYDAAKELADTHRPKLIIAGGSAYPRAIDFARFRAIADSVDAYLMVDIAHISGLVATGVHPNPLPDADVVTTTTYKNLPGARGGIILTNSEKMARRIDSAVFPGLQGSTILNSITAKAVCLGEALKPEFRIYAASVLDNARTLASALIERGYDIVTGGTDTPLLLLDLRSKSLTGDIACEILEAAGLTCNKNTVPFDPQPPTVTSGLRFGVSAGTSRGFGANEFRAIGFMIADVLDGLSSDPQKNHSVEARTREQVRELCRRHPIYDQTD